MFTFGAWLCVEGFDGGWPSIFYIFGILGVISSVLFYLLMAESPSNQKLISKQESYFLQEATKLNQTQNKKKQGTIQLKKYVIIFLIIVFIFKMVTPWVPLFSSKICLAIYLTLFCYTWGGYCIKKKF